MLYVNDMDVFASMNEINTIMEFSWGNSGVTIVSNDVRNNDKNINVRRFINFSNGTARKIAKNFNQ